MMISKHAFSTYTFLASLWVALTLLPACRPEMRADSESSAQIQTTSDSAPTYSATSAETIRFVAFGDMGTGGHIQYEVARAVERKCRQSGCDFAVTLGDNIYNNGVSSPEDPQFQEKFEQPYAALDFPFYMVPGNHDYRGNVEAQVAYTQRSTRWKMPARYYHFQAGPVTFIALDTNVPDQTQQHYLKQQLTAAQTPWKIAFGHHPRYTNSFYYNTQSAPLKTLLDSLCGQAQLYLSGHEHDKQHLKSRCGVSYLVVGTGGGVRPSNPGPDTLFSKASPGFAWFEVTPRRLYFEILDQQGKVEYRSSLLRSPAAEPPSPSL